MKLLRIFKAPQSIRKNVMKHYLNKIVGKKSSDELMGAKNLFKLFKLIPDIIITVEKTEYKLRVSNETPIVDVYARKYPSSDVITLLEVWGKNEYSDSIRMLQKANIAKPNILDVGANVGYSAAYFKRYFPEAQITCIEPDRSNLNQVAKNIAINHFTNVKLVEGALWRKRAKMELKNDYREGTSASLYVVESATGNIEGYGIADVLALQNWSHIDFLKMDIEGAEKYLLEDESIAASILNPTRFIAIEIHDEKADRKKIYQTLTANGFTFFTKGDTTFGEKLGSKK